MQNLGLKFQDVEKKHQLTVQKMQDGIERVSEIRRMLGGQDPISAVQDLLASNQKCQSQVMNLQNAINVI